MKKVRYNFTLPEYKKYGLSNNEVYDVIEYLNSGSGLYWDDICLINDYGEEYLYNLTEGYNDRESVFTDVTTEYRNEIIDDILS